MRFKKNSALNIDPNDEKSSVVGQAMAEMIVDEFLDAEYEGGRHARRVDLITAIEEGTY